jgi:hypothetical protein
LFSFFIKDVNSAPKREYPGFQKMKPLEPLESGSGSTTLLRSVNFFVECGHDPEVLNETALNFFCKFRNPSFKKLDALSCHFMSIIRI